MQASKLGRAFTKKKKKSKVEQEIGRFDVGDELIAVHGHMQFDDINFLIRALKYNGFIGARIAIKLWYRYITQVYSYLNFNSNLHRGACLNTKEFMS